MTNQEYAEQFAIPVAGELGQNLPRSNDFKEWFYLRWGSIRFQVFWGIEANIKVILKIYRADGVCEQFIVDTDPCSIEWNSHQRLTREFHIHPFPSKLREIVAAKFAYIVHVREQSLPSQHEYIFMDGRSFDAEGHQHRAITRQGATDNTYVTYELDENILQRDVDWHNRHFDSLQLIPKFTKGMPYHPYHPKQFIHDYIDRLVYLQRQDSRSVHTIKVCVDCIDDSDFVGHLLYADSNGVRVQCIVDWRKMTLTNSDNYVRLKQSGIELLGVFCTPKHPLIEVAPDMHNKFIIFDEEACIVGSFNITFDRWGANWESGMTSYSQGMCRLLDNIFQSVRGGVIRPYRIEAASRFNLLYTFGRHYVADGGVCQYYRPHHAIVQVINRARHSIKACLFIIGELRGEFDEDVISALIHAHQRGVNVHLILNGHLAREGDPSQEYSMTEELYRPLLPAIARLKHARVPISLVYDNDDHRVPYSPLHAKYCIVDEQVVLDGSFNWYNTSIFSHDLLLLAVHPGIASHYSHEFSQILTTFRIF